MRNGSPEQRRAAMRTGLPCGVVARFAVALAWAGGPAFGDGLPARHVEPASGNEAVQGDVAATVRTAWASVDAAWNARDAEAFSRHFAADVNFRFVKRAQLLEGRAALFEHFREQFPRYAPDLRHATRIGDVRVVAPGIYTADGRVRIVRQTERDDTAVLRTFEIFAVMSESGGDLHIRALRIYEMPVEVEERGRNHEHG